MLTKEDLIYTVSYITSENIEDGVLKLTGATGFFYKTQKDGKELYLIISNKHFFENKNTFKFSMPFVNNNKEYTMNYTITITPAVHPTYDIGAICINDAIQNLKENFILKNKFIENIDLLNISQQSADSIEEALMIGYPFGLKSDNSTMPLIRHGIIATPLYFNYENREEFLVDILCFNGSSGSPIFINKKDRYYVVGIERSYLEYEKMNVGLGRCINSNFIKNYLSMII